MSETLKLLGASGATQYPQDYAPQLLETFANHHPARDYFVRFNCPEFTSLCPVTGQPDFAVITVACVPDQLLVESKSLKLYLYSFRNHGAFHEDCINLILQDLLTLMSPRYLEVSGRFTPRGGISIDPYANYGQPGTAWEGIAQMRLAHYGLHNNASLSPVEAARWSQAAGD